MSKYLLNENGFLTAETYEDLCVDIARTHCSLPFVYKESITICDSNEKIVGVEYIANCPYFYRKEDLEDVLKETRDNFEFYKEKVKTDEYYQDDFEDSKERVKLLQECLQNYEDKEFIFFSDSTQKQHKILEVFENDNQFAEYLQNWSDENRLFDSLEDVKKSIIENIKDDDFESALIDLENLAKIENS